MDAVSIEAVRSWRALPKWQQRLIETFGLKYKLGAEQRQGFTAPLPFYLFVCNECGRPSKDYPHGFIESRYLLCSHCEVRHSFTPWWVPLAIFWSVVKFAITYRFHDYSADE